MQGKVLVFNVFFLQKYLLASKYLSEGPLQVSPRVAGDALPRAWCVTVYPSHAAMATVLLCLWLLGVQFLHESPVSRSSPFSLNTSSIFTHPSYSPGNVKRDKFATNYRPSTRCCVCEWTTNGYTTEMLV